MKYLLFLIPFLLNAQNLLLFDDDVDNNKYAIDIAGTAEFASKTSPVGINLDSIKFTIIGWIKTPAVLNDDLHHIISTDKAATPRGWSLLAQNAVIYFIPDGSTGDGIEYSAGISVSTWYFIALVCTTTTQASADFLLYVDGALKSKSGTVPVVIQNANPLMIGQQGYDGFERYWLGQIGEIQIITNHNLSAAEITTAFTSGLSASYSAGTVTAWYKWSGKTDAEMLQDYSTSANNLTGNNVTTADQVKVGKVYK